MTFTIIDNSTGLQSSVHNEASTSISLRIDQAHIKRVLKAKRDLCVGEYVMSNHQKRLVAFVAEHGFKAKPVEGDAVEFDIPTFNVKTFAKGYDTERVASMAEAREILGY